MSTRPPPKRVRSDEDHSKASTQQKEEEHQQDREQKGEAEPNPKDQEKRGGEKKDEDWLAQPPFSVGKSWEGWETKWRQSCWCNKVAFVYDADPLQAKYCHCEDCQRLHGAPNQHAAVFKKDNTRLDSDPEWLGFLSAHGEVHPLSKTPTPLPHKISCRACGSPLMDEGRNMILSFPPTFEFPRTPKQLEEMNKALEKGNHAGPGGVDEVSKAEGGSGNKSSDDAPSRENHRRKDKWTKAGLPDCFVPKAHIFYERRVMDVGDGLPKWREHADKSEKMSDTER